MINKKICAIIVSLSLLIVISLIFFISTKKDDAIPSGTYKDLLKQGFVYNVKYNSTDDVYDLYFSKVKIEGCKVKDIKKNKGKCSLTIDAPSMDQILSEALKIILKDNKTEDYKALNAELAKLIEKNLNKELKLRTQKIEVNVIKKDDQWRIVNNDEFQFAINGKAYSLLHRMENELYE